MNIVQGLMVAVLLIVASELIPGLSPGIRNWLFVPGAIIMVLALGSVLFDGLGRKNE